MVTDRIRKMTRKTSPVWEHFEKFEKKNEDGTTMKNDKGAILHKSVCKVCKEKFVYGGWSGTTHLGRHVGTCGRNTDPEADQTVLGRTEAGDVFFFTFNQKRARRETVRYFVQEELALHKVEKPTFRRWIFNTFGPQFKPPCRNTLKSDILSCFLQEIWKTYSSVIVCSYGHQGKEC